MIDAARAPVAEGRLRRGRRCDLAAARRHRPRLFQRRAAVGSGHLDILERTLADLHAGAVVAVQIPDNKAEPNHVLMRDTAIAIGRADVVDHAEGLRDPVHVVDTYYRRLALARGASTSGIRPTSTPLPVPDAIVEWLKGTGLRPVSRCARRRRRGLSCRLSRADRDLPVRRMRTERCCCRSSRASLSWRCGV